MSLETPILFLVFNRPQFTRQVFAEIRKQRPKRLFIAADGPRPHVPGEAERCAEVRAIFDDIDWKCEVERRFSPTNLGCGKAVSSAITWFFDKVDAGIILEDDCLPDPSFYEFCTEMLARYRDDKRILAVSGDNFQDGAQRGDGSYYFSKLIHCWGWATWRRAWELYDFDMRSYPQYKRTNSISRAHPDANVQAWLLATFETIFNKQIDTWDLQFFYTLFANNGYCVLPNRNLVTNIGFGTDATHTFDSSSALANRNRETMSALVHPAQVHWQMDADTYTFYKHYGVTPALEGQLCSQTSI